jgi:hypothetical protein
MVQSGSNEGGVVAATLDQAAQRVGLGLLESLRALVPLDSIFSTQPARRSTTPWFVFEDPPWDPNLYSRGTFEAAVRNRFEQSLREYCDRVLAEARAQGLVKTEEKRNPDHYFWLAQYQVSQKSPADQWRSLPQGESRTRRAVEKAIRETARELGLTPRQSCELNGTHP